jgi:hypothetical protein
VGYAPDLTWHVLPIGSCYSPSQRQDMNRGGKFLTAGDLQDFAPENQLLKLFLAIFLKVFFVVSVT